MKVEELMNDLREDVPVDVTDETLLELAMLATVELRRRLPLYAIKQGDLPEEWEYVAKKRAALSYTLEDAVESGALFPDSDNSE